MSTVPPRLDEHLEGVQIEFREGLNSEQRDLAERSVAAMVTRSQEARTDVRAADDERARLEAAVNAPLARTIEDDPAAMAALKRLGETGVALDASRLELRRLHEHRADSFFDFIAPLPAGPIEERRPPYDYTWSWNLGGAATNQRFFEPSGFVSSTAVSGDTPGGVGGPVDVHAGYGIALTTGHSINLVARAETFLEFHFELATAVPGSWADGEGGIDITAFEDPFPGKPPLADRSQYQLWRKHKASTFPFLPDHEGGDQGPFTTWDPWGNIAFRMQPGHGYTLNVGVRAFANAGGTSAASGVNAKLNVWRLSLERIG
ncbi:hypothetical protein ACI8AF_12245 [Blastococcus sp. SYSU D00669]